METATLGLVNDVGGTGKTAGFGNGHKGSELVEIEGGCHGKAPAQGAND